MILIESSSPLLTFFILRYLTDWSFLGRGLSLSLYIYIHTMVTDTSKVPERQLSAKWDISMISLLNENEDVG